MQENLDQQITNNVPEFFFVWDLARQEIIHLTQGLRDYARVELTDSTDYERMLDFVHPDCRSDFEEILRGFSVAHAYQDHDLRVNEDKYRAKWLNLKSFPVENDQQEIVRVVAHISDVTERKEELSALEEMNDKNESIIRILAHDLKNPLSNIMMLSQLAEREVSGNNQPRALDFLKVIQETGSHMNALIGSMLELMELSDTRIDLDMHNTDLISQVNNNLQHFAAQFSQYSIKLVTEWPEEPIFVVLDAQKFQHVVNNLISNALKFTPPNGTVTVQISREGKRVLLAINDTGIGIPSDKHDEIFEEFSNARQRGLHGEKSTGLGLSIVKKIVELHQGEIRVDSTVGEGTTFTVILPF